MAITPLSTDTTLADFEAVLQSRTDTESVQKSGILLDEIDDIIHNAVKQVRTIAKKALAPSYVTVTAFVPSADGIIDLSTTSIFELSPANIVLRDTAIGEIDVVPEAMWQDLRRLYPAGSLNEACFARVATIAEKLSIEIYRGAGLVAYGTVSLTYSRMPVKALAAATKIDLPDDKIPIAEDIATLLLMGRLGRQVPRDVEQRVVMFITTQMKAG